jgi:5,10-methylenetetrahydromethanopterin reductase
VDISCAFATSNDTPSHIALAESLGYQRAWCYDSPPLYPDVWMILALAAERTSRIGLGPAVLVPHLRHVMTNAAAIATLVSLAPGRVSVAVGSGFTGRMALGQRSTSWKAVREYVSALRALLRGEEVMWEGALTQMLHLPGFAPPRPIDVPLAIAISGPRGLAVAQELADGVISPSGARPGDAPPSFDWVARMTNGTVLDPGEPGTSQRALEAAGHGAALAYHATYENGQVEALPNGTAFREAIEAIPAERRHLVLHKGHLITMSDLDRRFVTPEFMAQYGRASTPEVWRERLSAMEAEGVTEVIYQPAGPDIPRELGAFAATAGIPA